MSTLEKVISAHEFVLSPLWFLRRSRTNGHESEVKAANGNSGWTAPVHRTAPLSQKLDSQVLSSVSSLQEFPQGLDHLALAGIPSSGLPSLTSTPYLKFFLHGHPTAHLSRLFISSRLPDSLPVPAGQGPRGAGGPRLLFWSQGLGIPTTVG